MARPHPVLHRSSAIPGKDCAWRSFLDGGFVRGRLVGTTQAISVAARALAEIRLNPFPQRSCPAGKVAWRFWLGKAQAHRRDGAPVDLMREQCDRTKCDNIANFRAPPELFAEIIGKSYIAVIRSDLQSIDFRQRA